MGSLSSVLVKVLVLVLVVFWLFQCLLEAVILTVLGIGASLDGEGKIVRQFIAACLRSFGPLYRSPYYLFRLPQRSYNQPGT